MYLWVPVSRLSRDMLNLFDKLRNAAPSILPLASFYSHQIQTQSLQRTSIDPLDPPLKLEI